MADRETKRVSDSAIVTTRLMMPQDANVQGNVFGGAIMRVVDEIAGTVAALHSRKNVVTASMDQMSFYKPVYVGNLLILKASVNYVGLTSMEVGVRIEARNLLTGNIVHTGSSYLTLVALDDEGKPTVVANILPQTADEKRRYAEARERKARRFSVVQKSA
ncbi:MAG: acyl-CoA thioesterase [Nitrososphaerales archaeon]